VIPATCKYEKQGIDGQKVDAKAKCFRKLQDDVLSKRGWRAHGLKERIKRADKRMSIKNVNRENITTDSFPSVNPSKRLFEKLL
jgi:hypothetical protein